MTFPLWSGNTKQVQQMRALTKYKFALLQKKKNVIKILMSKFLGQNICSRTKMPQVGFQSIRKIRATWSCPWLLLLFQIGIWHDRHRKSTWNISAPNMKQMRSNEMVAPQTPSIYWKPSQWWCHKGNETLLLLQNARGSLSAQTSTRKFTFSQKGADYRWLNFQYWNEYLVRIVQHYS